MIDKTLCRTPEGKTGTNIPTWKFETCRAALLAELDGGSVPAKDIAKRAGERLTDEQRVDLGSLGWHMTTISLELETRGEIERLPGVKPVMLRRVATQS